MTEFSNQPNQTKKLPIASKSTKVGDKYINEITIWNAQSKDGNTEYVQIVVDSSYLVEHVRKAKETNNGQLPEKIYFAAFYPKDKVAEKPATQNTDQGEKTIDISDLPF